MKKTSTYDPENIRTAQLAKALSHPARIRILKLLLEKDSCVCGSIVDEIPLAQSTVSQHLKELKSAGLIKGEIEGKTVCYCISPEGWEEASGYFSDFFTPSPAKPNCC